MFIPDSRVKAFMLTHVQMFLIAPFSFFLGKPSQANLLNTCLMITEKLFK